MYNLHLHWFSNLKNRYIVSKWEWVFHVHPQASTTMSVSVRTVRVLLSTRYIKSSEECSVAAQHGIKSTLFV